MKMRRLPAWKMMFAVSIGVAAAVVGGILAGIIVLTLVPDQSGSNAEFVAGQYFGRTGLFILLVAVLVGCVATALGWRHGTKCERRRVAAARQAGLVAPSPEEAAYVPKP